jgi:opacity protein-like surface antigen
MVRKFTIVLAACLLSSTAAAQDVTEPVGAGPVEIAAVPGGGMFFLTSSNGTEPKFGNYTLGTSVTGNVNRWIGIEGDVSLALGVRQGLTFNQAALTDQKTPTMLGYNASFLYSPWGSDRRVAPYAAAGLGALAMFNTDDVENLGVTRDRTHLTSNIGAGLKWFPVPRWGVRFDYRFFMIRNDQEAPAFFGQEDREAHRIYGGLVFTN